MDNQLRNRKKVEKVIIGGVVLWCTLIVCVWMVLDHVWINIKEAGVDEVKIHCVWEGNNITLSSCINEVIQQEDWSSVEIANGESELSLPINGDVDWHSWLWQFNGINANTTLKIVDITLRCQGKDVYKYENDSLVDFFENSVCSNLEIRQSRGDVYIDFNTVDTMSVCRFSEEVINHVNEMIHSYDMKNLYEKKMGAILVIVEVTFLLLALTLGMILLSGWQGEKRRVILIYVGLWFLGIGIICGMNQPKKLQITYDSDSLTRIVLWQNETNLFDFPECVPGNNRKLNIETKTNVNSLVLEPIEPLNGSITIKRIKYLNAINFPLYEWKCEQVRGDINFLYSNTGAVEYKNGEGIFYSWHGEGSICRIGNDADWLQHNINLKRSLWDAIWKMSLLFTIALDLLFWGYNRYKNVHQILKCLIAIEILILAYIWAKYTADDDMILPGMGLIVLGTWMNYRLLANTKVNLKQGGALILLAALCYGVPLACSHYFFGDEWLGYGVSGGMRSLLTFGRVFQSLSMELFSFVTPDTVGAFRLAMCIQAGVYSLCIYSFIKKRTTTQNEAFLLTGLLCCSSAMVDCVAYTSINTYVFSLCMVIYSFSIYEKALLVNRARKYICLACSVCWIVLACHAYQLGLTIIFFLAAIELWYCSGKEVIDVTVKYLKYLLLMALGVVVYYTLLYAWSANVALNRGGMIGAGDIVGKFTWFFGEIIPTAISRCIAVFAGEFFFSNQLYWAGMKWKNSMPFGQCCIALFLLIFLVAIFLKALKEKEYLKSILQLLLIPASYGVMLLLSENSYHTYYAFPLISVLMFYFAESVAYLAGLFAKRKKKNNQILIVLFVMCILQSSYYVKTAWCSNEKTVDYIKETLLTNQTKEKWIHVYGEAFWGGHPVYGWRMMTNMLKWLGQDPDDYIITLSENENTCNRIWAEEYKRLEQQGIIDSMIFYEHYEYDKINNEYYLMEAEHQNRKIEGLESLWGGNQSGIFLNLNWLEYE